MAVFGRLKSSPSTSVCTGFSCFNLSAATSQLSSVVSRLMMLLKQTLGRQSSVLELLSILDWCTGLPCFQSSCHTLILICDRKAFNLYKQILGTQSSVVGTPPHPRAYVLAFPASKKLPISILNMWSQGYWFMILKQIHRVVSRFVIIFKQSLPLAITCIITTDLWTVYLDLRTMNMIMTRKSSSSPTWS
jgi:hypothetical protein